MVETATQFCSKNMVVGLNNMLNMIQHCRKPITLYQEGRSQ